MRIDSHQHFWAYDESEYDWIDEGMAIIRRDFAPRDLVPLLKRHGFGGSVAVQVRQCLEENDYLLRLADENEFIRGVVGWVDLRSASVREDLERFREHPSFVGVRHIVQGEPDERFLLREDFLRGIALLSELDLTYDILVYHHQLPAVLELVPRFPETRFILDHIAKPAIAKGEIESWASAIRELGRHENLCCKVSGMVTEADWRRGRPMTRSDYAPYLDVVLEAFGPTRLLYGSDWPVATVAASYDEVVEIVAEWIEPLTSDEKERILGANAIDFYRLEVSA
jgi:L-fuconolactonase